MDASMLEDDEDMIVPGSSMPNIPRDPEKEALQRERMKAYLEPRVGRDRSSMQALDDNSRDLSFAKLLMDSANQVGTIGGKAASSKHFDDYTQSLMRSNETLGNRFEADRKEEISDRDRKLKMMQYFQKLGLLENQANDAKTHRDRMYELQKEKNEIDRQSNQVKTSDGKSGKVNDYTLKLSKDFGDEEVVKRVNNYRDSLTNAEALFKNPSPLNDTSLLYQYVKANDPSTGVKDMELALASRSGSIWDRVKGYLEGSQNGQMTAEKRQQLMSNLRSQANAAEHRIQETEQTYSDLSKKVGADPSLVIGARKSRYNPELDKPSQEEKVKDQKQKTSMPKKAVEQMSIKELKAELGE